MTVSRTIELYAEAKSILVESRPTQGQLDRLKAIGAELDAEEQLLLDDMHDARAAADRKELSRQLDALGPVAPIAGAPYQPRSLGDALVRSIEYRAAAAAIANGEPTEFKHFIELKAAGDPVLEGTGDNATAIAPTWLPELYAPGLVQYPTRIQAVIRQRQLPTGASVNYPIVTTRSIEDVTTTAEAENKAGAEFAFDFVNAPLVKWTAFSAISDEFFSDAPTIAGYINDELLVMALQKEERGIAETLYTASTTASDGSTIQPTPTGYDGILEAMTMVRFAGGSPTAILINPYDWATLASTRSVAGDGGYFSGVRTPRPRRRSGAGSRRCRARSSRRARRSSATSVAALRSSVEGARASRRRTATTTTSART